MIWARGATDGAENAKAKRTELEHGAQIKKSHFVIQLGESSCETITQRPGVEVY